MNLYIIVGSVLLSIIFALCAIDVARRNKFKTASSFVGISAIFAVSAMYFDHMFVDFGNKWPHILEYVSTYLVIGVFYSFFLWFRYSRDVIRLFAIYTKERVGAPANTKKIISDFNSMMVNTPIRYPLDSSNRKALILTFWLGWPYYFVRDIFKNPLIIIGKIFTKIFGPVFGWLSRQAEKSA